VIALVYGENTDWLRNVLASGSATLVHEGRDHRVERPEVVPMAAVAGYLPVGDRWNHRMFGIDRCLRVRLVEPDPAARR
jgi:hypothetical protein